jgi:xanthine dehydrogenase YagT iron-sulfur-binding subunit
MTTRHDIPPNAVRALRGYRAGSLKSADSAQQHITVDAPGDTYPVKLTVNGQPAALMLDSRVTLLDALRDHLSLTGTKKGCDHGQCGACTVLLGDRRIKSCMTLAVMHNNQEVTTIEGLAKSGNLSRLQKAFIQHDAFQCGFCTAGQLMSATGLLNEVKKPSTDQIRELMSGNLCRCGAYPQIVAAILDASS